MLADRARGVSLIRSRGDLGHRQVQAPLLNLGVGYSRFRVGDAPLLTSGRLSPTLFSGFRAGCATSAGVVVGFNPDLHLGLPL